MKRMLITALVSTGLLVAPGCKGDKAADGAAAEAGEAKEGAAEAGVTKAGESDGDKAVAVEEAPKAKSAGSSDPKEPLAMIPAGAFMAFSVDVGGLQNLPVLGGDLIEKMIKDPDDKATYAAMRDCGLTLDLMSRFTVGAEEKDGGMAILDGKGIAVKSKAECIAKYLDEKKGRTTTFSDGDGFTKLTDGKDALLYLVGDDRIIFTETGYGPKVEEMIAGKGAKAIEGNLAGPLAIADTSATIMGIVGLSDDQRAKMGPDAGPLSEMSGAAFSAGQSGDGVKFGLRIAMPDAAKANSAKDFLTRKYAEIKPMAGMLGIPPQLADKLAFGADGRAATASLALSAADLAMLKTIAEAQAGQMRGGPPGMGAPPGMPPGMPGAPPGGMPGGM